MDGFNQFISWDMLKDFVSFVSILFITVNFTKELPFIKSIPTKYWSAILCFTLLVLVNLHNGTFALWDTLLYALSAIMISLTGNGIADFNKKSNGEL